LKPSTGELSAIIGMLSAIDRNQCPQSIGTPVRNPRNPQTSEAFVAMWHERVAHFYSKYMATAVAEQANQ